MSVKITYFVHGTTTDNEKHISSGWKDVELSELGIKQSVDLKEQTKDQKFDVVFCSDLQRAHKSAELAWDGMYEIIPDARLRECNYGELNGASSDIVEPMQEEECITRPFPKGESYEDVKNRVADFLTFLKKNYDGKHIAIVAHKAPQLSLDVLLKGKTWEQALAEDWRKKKAWQPGWTYVLNELASDAKYKGRKYKVLHYSKDWQERFVEEADILKSILKDDALAIEHIGSTAVEGLAGKPTIDILVVIENVAIVDKHTPEMIAAGYRDLGEYVLPDTRLFVREEDNTRLVNVHFFLQGHPHTEEMILVRDYLRSHPEEVKKYGELKQRLYQEHPNDYGAYRKPKDEYMEELLKRAKSSSL